MPATPPVVEALRCEYKTNPIGIDVPRPRLSWRLRADASRRGLTQSAYQVTVGTADGKADLWDSGKVASDQSVQVEYAGVPLKSGERAHWRVRVWDETGAASEPSPTAFFEAGLLARSDWQGQWVGSTLAGGTNTQVPAPFVRKAFSLPDKPVASARLYATALGLYEFHLNGHRVGDDAFTPGWTDYRKRVQYQAYDVTAMLKPGHNAVGAILGDGWYCGYIGNIGRRQFYGDRPKLLAQLVVRFADGTTQTVATDQAWRVTDAGPILAADLMMGEDHDARLEMPSWATAKFQESPAWRPVTVFPDPGVPIVATPGPTVGAAERLKPLSVRQDDRGWGGKPFIVDLGQNMVGRVRLRIRAPKAGQTITLKFAEVLDKNTLGRPYTANLRTARQVDRYTMRGDGSEEAFEPRFTFHGFRYVEVAGYPGELSADDITGVVLHSAHAPVGRFECSEPLVNQLQHNIQWGWKGNSVDVPTDCPQRDERLGWTGDAQVFVRTACFNTDAAGFFTKWLQDMADAQLPGGGIPSIVPDTENASPATVDAKHDSGPAWSDAASIVPWTVYLCYADRRLLADRFDLVARYVDRLATNAEPFGLIRSHPDSKGWHGYGDWLATDAGRENVMGATPKDLIGTAFLSQSARLASRMAAALGRREDERRFADVSANAAAAFNERFVTPRGLVAGNTQTSYVLALHFDLLPEPQRATAVTELVRLIEQRGWHLSTGFVGTPYLLHVLTRFGRLDVAYKLLLQKSFPSWLYPVTLGATTIWERWDGWTEDKGFQDAGMNSFNHYAYGAVGDWLYQVVAGIEIDPDRPGYKHAILKPQPGPGLTHAAATLQTQHGPLTSGWRVEDGRIAWTVEVPPNTAATAHVPTTSPGDVREGGQPVRQSRGVTVGQAAPKALAVELVSGTYKFDAPWEG
ncbi:MAG TPA: family 78 glycoside hydrolase catalytic domain [Tepidisphaeraceae bacterium]|nr:family 78 glycoside hydrolase catalytic domain [Tepidisphaeraceae bacterium]